MKGYLESKGIPFTEKNIRDDADAYQMMIDLEYKTTPVLVKSDGTHFHGMKMAELEKLVADKTA